MLYLSILLVCSILAIILLSSRFKFNTFFALLLVAVGTGFAAGMNGEQLLTTIKAGFGHTLEKIGLLIILGTTLGILLDKTNATLSLANYLLAKTGKDNAPLAVTLMGFIVGLPIFCDSGFVVLIGLVMMLSRQVKDSQARLTICLATALYAVHCLVPPHPGISAAAGTLRVDLGQAMLVGTCVAIVPTVAAFFWIKYASKWQSVINDTLAVTLPTPDLSSEKYLPSPLASFLPIIIPIGLIALKSILLLNQSLWNPIILNIVKFIGDPVIALGIGIILSLFLFPKIDKATINELLDQAIGKSGPILAIIAAGGAFGEVIKTLDLGKTFGDSLAQSGFGLLAPFLLTLLFKTAQGSSTVAIISAASILEPLLPALGLGDPTGRLLALLAMGSGSMLISHANDAYFWVISRFGFLSTSVTLRVYTTASILMGIVAFLTVWILQWVV